MKLVVRLIHGIHTPEGNNNISACLPHLKEFLPEAAVYMFSYGFMGFWAARWNNKGVARNLATLSKAEKTADTFEVWITHSNGQAVSYLAVEKFAAKPDMILAFNPALDRWRTPSVPRVEVMHSKGDRWVNLSQWLPGHIWGDQGKVGYKGKATNTVNNNVETFPAGMQYSEHSGAFTRETRKQWMQFCAHKIKLRFRLYTFR